MDSTEHSADSVKEKAQDFFSCVAPRVVLGMLLFVFLAFILIQEGSLSSDNYRHPRDPDCVHYVRQAQAPFTVTANPFAFRILTPLLVQKIKQNTGSLLGWNGAWTVFTMTVLYVTGLVFYRFCRRHLRLDSFPASLAVAMLLGNWIFGCFQCEIPFFVDPLQNLLWIVALNLLLLRRYDWFYVTLAIGMFNKEVILLLAPLGALLAFARAGRLSRAVWGHAGLAIGLFGVYAVYRLGLGHALRMTEYRLMTAYDCGVGGTILGAIAQQTAIVWIFKVVGFVWLFYIMALKDCWRREGWRSPLLLLSLYLVMACFGGRLFAIDANRVFVLLAPLAIGMSMQYWVAHSRPPTPAVLTGIGAAYMALNWGWIKDENLAMLTQLGVALWIISRLRPAPPCGSPESSFPASPTRSPP